MSANSLGGVVEKQRFVVKTEGIIKLAEALTQTKIQDLKCAPPCTCQTLQADQQLRTLVGQPDCLALFGSLVDNSLGPQGGAALAEAIKGNTTLNSLKCACNCQIRKVVCLAD